MVFLTWYTDDSAAKIALLWDKKIPRKKYAYRKKNNSHNYCSFSQAIVNQRHASSKTGNSEIA